MEIVFLLIGLRRDFSWLLASLGDRQYKYDYPNMITKRKLNTHILDLSFYRLCYDKLFGFLVWFQ